MAALGPARFESGAAQRTATLSRRADRAGGAAQGTVALHRRAAPRSASVGAAGLRLYRLSHPAPDPDRPLYALSGRPPENVPDREDAVSRFAHMKKALQSRAF